ncbi:MAG: hypothetical protein RL367_836, partial [Pseudomonadota bacterium]
PSSLHVSLPDEMRQFVDHRTNGKRRFATPSEYVRALIRADLDDDDEARFVHKALLQSAADNDAGRVHSASVTRTARIRATGMGSV